VARRDSFDPAIKKDFLIAELQNLRQEQFGRSNAQYAMIGANFTVAAAIGAIAVSQYMQGGLFTGDPNRTQFQAQIERRFISW
jgi:hypothetical protein